MSNGRAMRRQLAGVKGVSKRKRTKSARGLQRALAGMSGAAEKMAASAEKLQELAAAENVKRPPAEAEGQED